MFYYFLYLLYLTTAIPLSLNYIGEFLSLTGVYIQSPFASALGAAGIVLSAAYSIWLYTRLSYGSYGSSVYEGAGILKDINRREFHLLIPLLIITLVLGVLPNTILNDLHLSVSNDLFDNVFLSNSIFFFVYKLSAKSTKQTAKTSGYDSKTIVSELDSLSANIMKKREEKKNKWGVVLIIFQIIMYYFPLILVVKTHIENKKYNYFYLIILNSMGLNIPENAEPILNLLSGILTLSLIGLFSFLNLCSYIIIMYILNKYKVEEIKYTKYNLINKYITRVINTYKKNYIILYIFWNKLIYLFLLQ